MALTARYTEQVVALVTPEMKEALEKEADAREVSRSVVIRERLEKSYETERKPMTQVMEEVDSLVEEFGPKEAE